MSFSQIIGECSSGNQSETRTSTAGKTSPLALHRRHDHSCRGWAKLEQRCFHYPGDSMRPIENLQAWSTVSIHSPFGWIDCETPNSSSCLFVSAFLLPTSGCWWWWYCEMMKLIILYFYPIIQSPKAPSLLGDAFRKRGRTGDGVDSGCRCAGWIYCRLCWRSPTPSPTPPPSLKMPIPT